MPQPEADSFSPIASLCLAHPRQARLTAVHAVGVESTQQGRAQEAREPNSPLRYTSHQSALHRFCQRTPDGFQPLTLRTVIDTRQMHEG